MRPIIAAVIAGIVTCSALPSSAADNEVPLQFLVSQVKVALLKAHQEEITASLPPLKEAKLVVKSSLSVEADGSVTFFVVKVGADTAHTASSDVELVLAPPDVNSPQPVSSVQIADALKSAILGGSSAIAAAAQGDPPLVAKSFKATIAFVLEDSASGGVEIAFPPVSGELSGEVTSLNTHSITVTYSTSE